MTIATNKKNTVVAEEGGVAIAKSGTGSRLVSLGFLHCNLIVLRDRETGDSAMMHFFPSNLRNKGKNTEGLEAGLAPLEVTKIAQFLSQHKDVVGVSLYSKNGIGHPWHGVDTGGPNDHGSTEELRLLGVKMFRHNIPVLAHNHQSGFQTEEGFDAEYDVDCDTLRIECAKKQTAAEPALIIKSLSKRSFFEQQGSGMSR